MQEVFHKCCFPSLTQEGDGCICHLCAWHLLGPDEYVGLVSDSGALSCGGNREMHAFSAASSSWYSELQGMACCLGHGFPPLQGECHPLFKLTLAP